MQIVQIKDPYEVKGVLKVPPYKYYKTVTYPDGKNEDWYIIKDLVYGPFNLIKEFV